MAFGHTRITMVLSEKFYLNFIVINSRYYICPPYRLLWHQSCYLYKRIKAGSSFYPMKFTDKKGDKNMKRHETQKSVAGFQVLEDECIWMKAGVVSFRKCDNDYDCATCPFDRAMRRSMKKHGKIEGVQKAITYAEQLKMRYDGASRPCRHALTGRVDAPKICTNNYECQHCAYDQMLDEMDMIDDIAAPAYRMVAGYRVADSYYYHSGHTWARFEHSGRTRIGFDDFFGKLFGTPEKLELPPLGAKITQGDPGFSFSRDQHAAGVLAPVTGTVLAVNHKVRSRPEISHRDPYRHGWLFIVEPEMPKRNLKQLLFGRECDAWIEQEQQQLLQLIGPEYRSLAATGAQPVDDLIGSLPEIGWDRIVRAFLRTGAK